MKPLEGIKVVELGTHVAVPMAARLMADWGAEVIKVESLTGDLWRSYGLNVKTPVTDEENPIFAVPNANKRLIALNLKTDKGREDVFMSNVRLKGLKGLGLDYESLSRRFPKLVYFHFTGYGYDGPWAKRPGFDIAAFWSAGAMIGRRTPFPHPRPLATPPWPAWRRRACWPGWWAAGPAARAAISPPRCLPPPCGITSAM